MTEEYYSKHIRMVDNPKGLGWKDVPVKKDPGFFWNKIQVQEFQGALHIKMSPYPGIHLKPYFLRVDHYDKMTANELILEIYDRMWEGGSILRHVEDAIYAFYRIRGLNSGFTIPILKPLVRSSSKGETK